MKTIKAYIVLLLINYIFSSDHEKLKLLAQENGRPYKIINCPQERAIQIEIKNTCNKKIFVNNLKVTFTNMKVNNGLSYQITNIQPAPWFLIDTKPMNGFENNNEYKTPSDGNLIIYIKSQTNESWGYLKENASLIVKVKFYSDDGYNSITVDDIYLGDSQTEFITGKLHLKYKNLPGNLYITGEVYEIFVNQAKLINTFIYSKENHCNTLTGIPLNSKLKVVFKGYLTSDKKINSIIREIDIKEKDMKLEVDLGEALKDIEYKIIYIRPINCFYNENQKQLAVKLKTTLFDFNYLYIGNNGKVINFRIPKSVSLNKNDIFIFPPIHLEYRLNIFNQNSNITYFEIACSPRKTKSVGIYWESWKSANIKFDEDYSKMSLGKLPENVDRVLVSFIKPTCQYKKLSFESTRDSVGLDFWGKFNLKVLRDLILVARVRNPNIKFLLSVGGWSYNEFWAQMKDEHIISIVDLINDVDADGVDIDFEADANCSGWALNKGDKDYMKCETDSIIINYIKRLKKLLPKHKLITAATTGTGAYGTPEFPATEQKPEYGINTGRWVNILRKQNIDEIFDMTYDGGNCFNVIESFKSFVSLTKNKTPVYIGLEVPYEPWPKRPDKENHVLSVEESKKYAEYCMKDKNCKGIFIWAAQKAEDEYTVDTFLQPVCKIFNLPDCDVKIFSPS